MPQFKLVDPDGFPAFRGPDRHSEHQFNTGFLAPGIGNDFQPSALFDKQALETISGADQEEAEPAGDAPRSAKMLFATCSAADLTECCERWA